MTPVGCNVPARFNVEATTTPGLAAVDGGFDPGFPAPLTVPKSQLPDPPSMVEAAASL